MATITHDPSESELVGFVVREARLLDEQRYDEWNALFTDDAVYWVPLVPNQPEGLDHTSHLHEDKLLRDLRIERLKSPRAFSQQPPTRSLHLLQTPTVEPRDPAHPAEHRVRTVFQYVESQGDEMSTFFGVCSRCRLRVGGCCENARGLFSRSIRRSRSSLSSCRCDVWSRPSGWFGTSGTQ